MEKYLNAIIAICFALVLAGVFALGMRIGIYSGDIKVAKLEKAQAEANSKTADDNLQKLITAQRRGDMLQQRLTAAEEARLTQAQEHSHEIKRLTHGQPCLNAGTVRLLNSTRGIEHPAVSETASRPAAEDAAAATDTDIAGWIDAAIRQYDTWRDRHNALIDFEETEEEQK